MVDGVKDRDQVTASRWRCVLSAAILGLALALLPPVAALAASGIETDFGTAGKAVGVVHSGETALMLELPRPALAPGLPPPDFTTISDRKIISGGILLLLAGFGGLTALMWRELGIRSRVR
ncbi:hypothetical protein EDC22_101543 [Tepidamorphus gemmatus]|uniref:PDGLE domain-containing protein n=1 Tax=Tepidamorphus gemmatus TaxID=747076 RepID=A0A4R3MJ58_9HYPH|nr:hypothetical protein [Tepidamorphus gemmatus]TCT13672.1 hypothetical protein EDC22_101543 [Tepidamorphus gemmatus]